MGKIAIIARREFNERVKKKSFIITTVLMPVFFIGLMALAVYMTTAQSDKVREIAVIDESPERVGSKLESGGILEFELTERTFDSVRDERPGNLFGILRIGENIISNSKDVQFYTFEASTMTIESAIEGQLNGILEDEKLKRYDIDNLAQIMADVKTDVNLTTERFTGDGESVSSSSALSMAIAYLLGLLIYMFIFLYGNMVMQGVIEEKSSKVLELMVSSVKPFQLMMGKIIGIASVAITQLLIWVAFMVIVGGAAMNMLSGDAAGAMAAAGDMQLGMGAVDAEALGFLGKLTDAGYMIKLVGGFILYFIGGYLLYAAMFAAVGSAVDNEKDTQNLQLPITIPLILGIFIMINAMNNPDSAMAVWFSMIPFTSPVVMMSRLAYDAVPGWELALSLALLYLTFMGIVWLAGKIYRVGIFMYGKKPSFGELYKWSRYKS